MDCMVPDIVRSAERGDESAVLASLRAGHSPDEEDDFGLTALHGAAKKGHLQVVSHLINERADVNKRATRLQGETPVLYACKYGNVEAVRMLLWHQADPSAATADGRTPAQLAQRRGHLEIVRILEGEASM